MGLIAERTRVAIIRIVLRSNDMVDNYVVDFIIKKELIDKFLSVHNIIKFGQQ